MARYEFWIHDTDEDGQPLDRDILEVAEQLAARLTRYRRREIHCPSTTNRMLQAAVEAASKAKHSRRIENPAGYLTFAYRRLVDKHLTRQQRVVPVDDGFLEQLADSGESRSFEERIHERLVLEKLLKTMDPDTRRVCNWRLQGYSIKEIAVELGVTPNTLSARYSRGVKKAMKQVFGGRTDEA